MRGGPGTSDDRWQSPGIQERDREEGGKEKEKRGKEKNGKRKMEKEKRTGFCRLRKEEWKRNRLFLFLLVLSARNEKRKKIVPVVFSSKKTPFSHTLFPSFPLSPSPHPLLLSSPPHLLRKGVGRFPLFRKRKFKKERKKRKKERKKKKKKTEKQKSYFEEAEAVMSHTRSLSDLTQRKIRELKQRLRQFDSALIDEVELDAMLQENVIEWNDELEGEFQKELQRLVRPHLTKPQSEDVCFAILRLMRDLANKITDSSIQASRKSLIELEAQLRMESELRALTESYQSELEAYVEALRNMNVQAKPKPKEGFSKSLGHGLFSKADPSIDEETELKITQLEAQNEYLQKELETLQEKYSSMVDSRAILFFEKEHLKLELETLTRDLFEEANTMVANESRLRAELQSSNQRLSEKLQGALEDLRISAIAQKEKYLQAKRRKSEQLSFAPFSREGPGSAALSPTSSMVFFATSPSPEELHQALSRQQQEPLTPLKFSRPPLPSAITIPTSPPPVPFNQPRYPLPNRPAGREIKMLTRNFSSSF